MVTNSVEVSGALLTADIDEAILKSWKPSYEGVWESEYRRYKLGIKSKNEFLTTLRASLTSRYYMDGQMSRYALYLPEDEIPSCYAGKNGYSWEDYIEKVQPLVRGISEKNLEVCSVVLEDGHGVTGTPGHLVYAIPQFYDGLWYHVVMKGLDGSWRTAVMQGYDVKFCLSDASEVYVLGVSQDEVDVSVVAAGSEGCSFEFPTLESGHPRVFYDGREDMEDLERRHEGVVRYGVFSGKMATVLPLSQVLPGYQMFVEGRTGRLEAVVVSKVQYSQYDGKVYDLNLPCCRNFLANGVLVHNCIYSFKGSDFRILAEYFDNDFRPTHCRLSYNWRCPANILNPVVASIHKNDSSAGQKIVASNPGGDFRAVAFPSYRSMLQALKEDVGQDMQDGYSVAVLCRTNFDGMIPAIALESEGGFDFSVSGENMTLNSPLPRKIIGVSSLFTERSSPAVKTALGYFVRRGGAYQVNRVIDTCKTNNMSVWQIPDEDLRYSAPDLYSALKPVKEIFIMPDGSRDKTKEVAALVYCYRYLMATTFSGASAFAEGARAYIEVLLYLIDVNQYGSVYDFLDAVEFLNDKLQGRVKKKRSHIQIATVHESKGKEWDSVYVWNDSDGVFPGSKCDLDSNDEVEEERRVHYIACTRAKKKERIYTLSSKVGMFVKEMDLTLESPKPSVVRLKKETVGLEDAVG